MRPRGRRAPRGPVSSGRRTHVSHALLGGCAACLALAGWAAGSSWDPGDFQGRSECPSPEARGLVPWTASLLPLQVPVLPWPFPYAPPPFLGLMGFPPPSLLAAQALCSPCGHRTRSPCPGRLSASTRLLELLRALPRGCSPRQLTLSLFAFLFRAGPPGIVSLLSDSTSTD